MGVRGGVLLVCWLQLVIFVACTLSFSLPPTTLRCEAGHWASPGHHGVGRIRHRVVTRFGGVGGSPRERASVARAVGTAGQGGGEAKKKNIAVHVTRSAETGQRKRHPWLFESDIRKLSHEGEPGDVAVVFDNKKQYLSVGLFDPYSPIRVRVLHHNEKVSVDSDLVLDRVRQAAKAREGILPPDTDGFRVINGENDGLGGLVVDRYGSTLVAKVYSSAWLVWMDAVKDALVQVTGAERLVLLMSRQLQKLPSDILKGYSHGCILHGPPLPEGVLNFVECGITFECDPIRGQKTGFFLDQRENRMRVEKLAKGRSVLNVFSYTGGFSLYAARGGASEVTSVDISTPATEAAMRNFNLNQDLSTREGGTVGQCRHIPVAEDAFQFMREAAQSGRSFDVVIVDPPSMANKASLREVAIKRYTELASLAAQVVKPGGKVVLASCSSRVSTDQFFSACFAGVAQAGKSLLDVEQTQHAVDHPLTFAEGSYLKCMFATVC